MSSLSSKSGNLIQDQKEILNETMQFCKDLFSKREVKNVDFNALFANFSVLILGEEMKNKVEGPLPYSELLFCLKKSSNNTSPGYDEFSYEFFKVFWNDIGHFMFRAFNYGINNGELSDSQKRGATTCIPKGNKDIKTSKKLATNISFKCDL